MKNHAKWCTIFWKINIDKLSYENFQNNYNQSLTIIQWNCYTFNYRLIPRKSKPNTYTPQESVSLYTSPNHVIFPSLETGDSSLYKGLLIRIHSSVSSLLPTRSSRDALESSTFYTRFVRSSTHTYEPSFIWYARTCGTIRARDLNYMRSAGFSARAKIRKCRDINYPIARISKHTAAAVARGDCNRARRCCCWCEESSPKW